MKILVTGSSGFIGQHLLGELLEAGHEIRGVAEKVDLLEPGAFRSILAFHETDVVVHLAAKVGRLFGEMDQFKTVVDNAGMTTLVASACGDAGVRLAYASTSEVYGDQDYANCFEDVQAWLDAGKPSNATWPTAKNLPHNIYGLSKRWGEEVCALYTPFGLQVLRLSMPYGPGHPPGKGRAALTNFLYNAMHHHPITVHRDSERSWCWVGDTVRGIRMVLESGQTGAWNIGRDDNALPLRTVAERACALVGAPDDLITEIDPPARQTVVKRLSTAKLRRLGWAPEVELEEGMERTLLWLAGLEEGAA